MFEFTLSPSTYYDVWLQGQRIETYLAVGQTTYIYDWWTDTEEPPPLEFVDYGETPASYDYPPHGVLQWFGDTSVYRYSVEQYVDSAWTVMMEIAETGQGYYQHTTAVLADESSVLFRVVPYDSEGFSGEPLDFTVVVVAHPTPPSIDVTYDSDNVELDITERV